MDYSLFRTMTFDAVARELARTKATGREVDRICEQLGGFWLGELTDDEFNQLQSMVLDYRRAMN